MEGDILNVSRRNDVTEEEIQRMVEDIAEEAAAKKKKEKEIKKEKK